MSNIKNMSLIEKLKKEIASDPWDLLGKKVEVKCECDEVVYPKETMEEMMDDNIDDTPVEWVKED